jgi:uncharacterized YigZ family protein
VITLAGRAAHALEVRKSRFVAHAGPVETPAAALAFVAEVSDPGATHNCWAYRLGGAYRSSDDGEPGGTAGRPILQAIDGQGVDHVVVVVTRWFGGIKLGAGGLVRAYGGCAAECLRLATRIERIARVELALRCAFDDLGVVHSLIARHDAVKLGESYETDAVALRVALPGDRRDAFLAAVADATRGRAVAGERAEPDGNRRQ